MSSEPDAPPPREQDPECLRRGCLVTAETLHAALYGGTDMSAPIVLHELPTGKSRTLAPPEVNDPDLVDCRDELKGGLSPDGRFGLRNCKLRRYTWPGWWSDYTAPPDLKAVLAAGNNGYLRQWILYDFERGTSSRLSSAPYFSRAAPLWVDGGRRFILAGAFEPLTDVDANERARRSSHYAVLVVDPATRKTQRVAEFDPSVQRVTAASWNERTQTLTVEAVDNQGRSLVREVSRRADGRWSKLVQPDTSSATAELRRQPQLSIKQSLNDRPVLIATHPRTGATVQVLDPNPWLAQRAVGRVARISWKSREGREWRGGIYYPSDYRSGVRYPVVLQTHGFEDNVFSLYGIARNFAAQPLAGLGILVLQIDENTAGAQGADQWPVVQAGYESAIDHLDELGLIDRQRVGIQGWSWTGPTMGYTLTQSPYRFVAGAFTVTADFGWWWYLTQGARHGESEYGAPPFGDGLDAWRKMSPSFNLHRVTTPMLMCSDGVTVLWDWYVGLRRLGKPVEYWSLPQVTHDVFKVEERMLMNQLTVDWFRFWLKAEEDLDPAKAEQYLRWRALRRQQELDLGNPGSHGVGARESETRVGQ
jgi:dipeptidyl aminopeptidase/acylaminoacyl peptidase